MSLKDDVRWLLDGADSLLAGALPLWPEVWSTASGKRLQEMLVELHRRYFQASLARSALEAQIRILKDNVDGLRETNVRLTELLERTERRLTDVIIDMGTDHGEPEHR